MSVQCVFLLLYFFPKAWARRAAWRHHTIWALRHWPPSVPSKTYKQLWAESTPEGLQLRGTWLAIALNGLADCTNSWPWAASWSPINPKACHLPLLALSQSLALWRNIFPFKRFALLMVPGNYSLRAKQQRLVKEKHKIIFLTLQDSWKTKRGNSSLPWP